MIIKSVTDDSKVLHPITCWHPKDSLFLNHYALDTKVRIVLTMRSFGGYHD